MFYFPNIFSENYRLLKLISTTGGGGEAEQIINKLCKHLEVLMTRSLPGL